MSVSRTLGTGLPLAVEGRTLLLYPLTWRMLGTLESMLASDALAAVERTREHSLPATYRARLNAVSRLIEAGEYDMDGKAWARHLRTARGFARMVWLMLGRNDPAVTPAEAERMVGTHGELLTVLVRLLNRPGKARNRTTQTDAPPVPFETRAAVLAAEPCLVSLDQIADMTPYQTAEVYFHERDGKGNILLPTGEPELNERNTRAMLDVFVSSLRAQGVSDQEIDERWERMFDRLAGVAPAEGEKP